MPYLHHRHHTFHRHYHQEAVLGAGNGREVRQLKDGSKHDEDTWLWLKQYPNGYRPW